jgi:DNA-binding GntR family transcriptional regulator
MAQPRLMQPEDQVAVRTISARRPGADPADDSAGSGGNLGELAYQRLLDLLLSGELPAGTILQERRLAEALNISRTPIREALGRLEVEGLMSRQFGRLMVVSHISVRACIETFNVRKLLEVEAAGLAAKKRIDKAAAESVRVALRSLMETKSPTAAQRWKVDDMVHSLIADAAENALLATMLRDLRRRTHIFDTRPIPARLRPDHVEHLAIIDAAAAGDPERSRGAMAEHIDNVKATIVGQLAPGRSET